MDRSKYVGGKQACKILGVHVQTLYNWEKKGLLDIVRSPGGKRFYNVEKYLQENNIDASKNTNSNEVIETKEKICYIRVSTSGQKDDLKRQRDYMHQKYKRYTIVEDIGSGINFNRRGLRKIIDMAIDGKIDELVVAHRDRLTRFGFDLIEDLIKKYSNGKIIIDDDKENKREPKDELVEDVLQILNVYTAKMNGLRKYKKI